MACAANRFTVPPIPSQGPSPREVAEKCHSAGIPKSLSWRQRLWKFFGLYTGMKHHLRNT